MNEASVKKIGLDGTVGELAQRLSHRQLIDAYTKYIALFCKVVADGGEQLELDADLVEPTVAQVDKAVRKFCSIGRFQYCSHR